MTNVNTASFSADSLLDHGSWAHSLARSLVGASDADDLVSETWLIALQAKPLVDRPLRPWLGTVLGNLARQRARSKGRRAERERMAARDEAQPSAGELTARAESQKLLMEELLKLDVDLREILLLRFFENKSAAEIGRIKELPASTVKSRLERGLDQMRVGLDQRFEGQRSLWSTALLPLLQGAEHRGMSTLVKLALSLCVVTATSLGLVFVGMGGLEFMGTVPIEAVGFAPIVEVHETDFLEDASQSERVAFVTEIESPGVEATPESDATRFRMRFLDLNHHPMPDVRVNGVFDRKGRFALSDANGIVDWSFTPKHAGMGYSVSYSHMAIARDTLSVQGAESEVTDLGDIIVRPGGALRGRVLDGLGTPLAGAKVEVLGESIRGKAAGGLTFSSHSSLGHARGVTDETGSFQLSGLLVGDVRVHVEALRGLHKASSGWVEIREGQESHGLVIFAPEAPIENRIEGVVYGPDGNPLGGVSVQTRFKSLFSSGSIRMSNSADGSFLVVSSSDADYELVFRAPGILGYAPVTLSGVRLGEVNLSVNFEPDIEERTVVLPKSPGSVVTGWVLVDGAAVIGAKLFLQRSAQGETFFNGFPVRYESRESSSTQSRADGSFELDVPEAGTYVLRGALNGYAPVEFGPVNLDGRSSASEIELNISAGGSLRGRVVLAAGLNPAGRLVAISRGDCWAESRRVGADGAYEFTGLIPGRWQVTLVDREIVDGVSTSSTSSFSPVEIQPPFNCVVHEGESTEFDLSVTDVLECELVGQLEMVGSDPSLWRGVLISRSTQDGSPLPRSMTFKLDAEGRFAQAGIGIGEWRLGFEQVESGGLLFSAPLALVAGFNQWRSRVELTTLYLKEVPDFPCYYLWEGAGQLTGIYPVDISLDHEHHLAPIPAGAGRLVFYQEGFDPNDPRDWPTWRSFDLEGD
ncbi:MAG: RNA polymerase sigma-70 factor (ECF subfamily) [Planctomycetota bacterium]|jgi:RNA polymerase sigma-70 factor (ECF subfamily)